MSEEKNLLRLAQAGAMLPHVSQTVVAGAIALIASSRPMKALGEAEQQTALEMVRDALMPIGAKLAPNMDPSRASAWADAIAISLSRYSVRIALAAAKRGHTEPFRFIGDVDAKLHEIAQEIETQNAVALRRLRTLQAEIARSTQPKLPPADPPPPLTIEEISNLSESFIRIGIGTGDITEEQAEEARKLADERRKSAEFDTQQNDATMLPVEGKPVGDLL